MAATDNDWRILLPEGSPRAGLRRFRHRDTQDGLALRDRDDGVAVWVSALLVRVPENEPKAKVRTSCNVHTQNTAATARPFEMSGHTSV